MSDVNLNNLVKKLDRIKNHLAEEIAPDVNKLLKESVRFSLIDWYNDYDPQDYKRTYNFMRILDNTKTSGTGNLVTMTIDSGSMNNYPGWGEQHLQASTAYEFMFVNGEHGHGKWMKHKSIPPYMYVDADICSGFNGRINNIIDKTIEKILK